MKNFNQIKAENPDFEQVGVDILWNIILGLILMGVLAGVIFGVLALLN